MDYYVRYIDLPCCAKGVSVMDREGYYNIYINSHLSYCEQVNALNHEMAHLLRNDFEKTDESITTVENIR